MVQGSYLAPGALPPCALGSTLQNGLSKLNTVGTQSRSLGLSSHSLEQEEEWLWEQVWRWPSAVTFGLSGLFYAIIGGRNFWSLATIIFLRRVLYDLLAPHWNGNQTNNNCTKISSDVLTMILFLKVLQHSVVMSSKLFSTKLSLICSLHADNISTALHVSFVAPLRSTCHWYRDLLTTLKFRCPFRRDDITWLLELSTI